jgi:hypothetical protein
MLDVGREDTFCDILVVGRELGDGLEVSEIAGVGHFPDIAVALIVSCDEGGSIVGDGDGADGDVFFGDQFVCTGAFAKIPEFDASILVT